MSSSEPVCSRVGSTLIRVRGEEEGGRRDSGGLQLERKRGEVTGQVRSRRSSLGPSPKGKFLSGTGRLDRETVVAHPYVGKSGLS